MAHHDEDEATAARQRALLWETCRGMDNVALSVAVSIAERWLDPHNRSGDGWLELDGWIVDHAALRPMAAYLGSDVLGGVIHSLISLSLLTVPTVDGGVTAVVAVRPPEREGDVFRVIPGEWAHTAFWGRTIPTRHTLQKALNVDWTQLPFEFRMLCYVALGHGAPTTLGGFQAVEMTAAELATTLGMEARDVLAGARRVGTLRDAATEHDVAHEGEVADGAQS